MPDPQANLLAETIREARERLAQEFRSEAEQLDKVVEGVADLRLRHQRSAHEAEQQWEALARVEASLPHVSPEAVLENVLGAVGNLMTCALPERVLIVLTEEAARWGVRAAVFDVRGKAAWGAAAKGFGPELSDETFRSLIVPLTPGNPLQQVCEIGGQVDTNAAGLRKNRNILEKLKPAEGDPILLLPVRSAGAVAAILYADMGGKAESLPVNALKILSEFAGAQLDRLIALSGGSPAMSVEEAPPPVPLAPTEEVQEKSDAQESAAQQLPEEVLIGHGENQNMEPAAASLEAIPQQEPLVSLPPEAEPAPPAADQAGQEQIPAEAAPIEEGGLAPMPAPGSGQAEVDVSQLSEADQKLHKDARRFAKLLVSEIELYNKVKVEDGRKNKDLYTRLRADIDRSRQTFDKRFGKLLRKETDHFHEELVRILASNDSTLLGPDYPGPTA